MVSAVQGIVGMAAVILPAGQVADPAAFYTKYPQFVKLIPPPPPPLMALKSLLPMLGINTAFIHWIHISNSTLRVLLGVVVGGLGAGGEDT